MLLDQLSTTIALVVSVSLILSVMIAKLLGVLLPMAAQKFSFDPALVSSPIVTSVVDVTALLVYFLLATAVL